MPRDDPIEADAVETPRQALSYIRDDESGFGTNAGDEKVLMRLLNRRAKTRATRREIVEVARIVLENLSDDTTAYLGHQDSADRERGMLDEILDALGGY